jgi:hypothetical protein
VDKKTLQSPVFISDAMAKRALSPTDSETIPKDAAGIEPRSTGVILSVKRLYSDASDLEYWCNVSLYTTVTKSGCSPQKAQAMIPIIPTAGNIYSPSAPPMTRTDNIYSGIYTEMYQSFPNLYRQTRYSFGYYLMTYIGRSLGIDPVIIVAANDLEAKEISDGYFSTISPLLKHIKTAPPYSLFRFRDEVAHETITFTDEGDLVQKDLFDVVFSSAILSKKRVRSAAFASEPKRKMIKTEPAPEPTMEVVVPLEIQEI